MTLDMTKKTKIFPSTFMWGASTASHQVEGDTYNQWTVWELEHAAEMAKSAKERLSWVPVWNEIKDQAQDPENYISGKGVEHYDRYELDFDILKALNMNSFRFGIEWSRIEPEEGKWDAREVEHYRRYILELRRRKIRPVLNIWHWTMPVWFTNKGGLEKGSNLKYWQRFVEKIAKEYGDLVDYVITLNEPNVYSTHSYIVGLWPPQEKSVIKGSSVYWNLVRAHKQAYKILKGHRPDMQIGIAAQLANIQAKRPRNLIDVTCTQVMRYLWNWWFLRRIRNHQDFVGINYYFTDYYKANKRQNPKRPLSDLGWYMEPEGLYPLMLRVWSHFKKPIIISENGLADRDDEQRRWWIEQTIVAMERALSEGVDVAGYFHWSLLDNFEWAYGWWPEFGLVHVDRKNGMKRIVRPSAKWLADKINEL
jgi:beta-glucosidase